MRERAKALRRRDVAGADYLVLLVGEGSVRLSTLALASVFSDDRSHNRGMDSLPPDMARFMMLSSIGLTGPMPSAPDALVSAQSSMFAELGGGPAATPFHIPVEFVWDRALEFLRDSQLGPVVQDALIRLYQGRAFFSIFWRDLHKSHLMFEGEDPTPFRSQYDIHPQEGGSFILTKKFSAMHEKALVGAAATSAWGVMERCLDLAERVARIYLDEPQPSEFRRASMRTRLRRTFNRLADPARPIALANIDPTVVKQAAADVALDPFPDNAAEYGGPVNESEADRLRHTWAHGDDIDPDSLSRKTLSVFYGAMDQTMRLTLLLMVGKSTKNALPEWYAAVGDPGLLENRAAYNVNIMPVIAIRTGTAIPESLRESQETVAE